MRRAFTLIEIIVVLVLLGVLGGLIVARVGGTASRARLVEAERLGALFDAAARRAAMRGQPVLVRFNPPGSAPRNPGTTQGADADSPGGGTFAVYSRPSRVGRFTLEGGEWEPDPLIAPVPLRTLRVLRVLRDGAGEPPGSGFGIVLNDPSTIGQRTTIVLAPADDASRAAGTPAYEIRLSSEARRVRTITDPGSLDPASLTPDGLLRVQTLDLDSTGLGGVAW